MMAAADATQQRLLQAAGEVFAEKGYQAATVREICARADVHNLAAVNYYFRDKETLYAEVLRVAANCRLHEEPEPAWPAGTRPEVKLRWFIGQLVEKVVLPQASQPTWHLQLMWRELTQPSPVGQQLVREFIRPVYERLWAILREVLPPDVQEQKLHLVAFSIAGQCMYHRLARPVIALLVGEAEQRSYTAEVLTEHITWFTCRALGLPASAEGETPLPAAVGAAAKEDGT
jgi:AcrR family transcriptional regulator